VNDQVLTILKGCLLALLYLFLARVIWVVNRELRGTPTTPTPPPVPAVTPSPARADRTARPARSTRAWSLVVHAPPTRRGETIAVDGEITIGRGGGCALSLPDDTFVSSLHARVFSREAGIAIEDLGSTNGTIVNGTKITGPVDLRKGDRIAIGSTDLEVRR
jgi:FHA domain